MLDNYKTYRYRKKKYAIIISVVCTIAVYFFMQSQFLQNFERKTYDYRLRLRGNRDISNKVVIVFVCNETINFLGYPLPRDSYASLIKCLKEFGAASVGFDIDFSRPNYDQYDQFLVDETEKAGFVFNPVYFYLSREEYQNTKLESSDEIIPPEKNRFLFYGQKTGLYQAVNVLMPFDGMRNACKSLGHVNVNPDMDGITRKLPLLIEYNGWIYSSLSFALACDYLGAKTDNITINYGKNISITIPGDKPFQIPINQHGEIYINYNDDLKRFKNYSVLQVLQAYKEYYKTGNPSFLTEIDLRDFKDKIVLIGLTALGTHDVHSTPFINKDALIGVHANVLDSILAHQFIYDAPEWISIFLSLLLSLLAGFTLPRFSFRRSILYITGSYFLISGIIIGSFLALGMVIAFFQPTLNLTATILIISMYLIKYEELEKVYLEREKMNITRKLWDKENQLHAIYDQLLEKEKALQLSREEVQKTLSESSQLKTEYDGQLKYLEMERQRLITQQSEISQNKELLESQLLELTIGNEEPEKKKKPSLTRDQLKGEYSFIKGQSVRLVEVLDVIDKAAPTMANIMITGPTGSGKELMAKAIHQNSTRVNGHFIAVNCAAIPRDLIEGELFGFEKGAFTGALNRHIGKFEQANSGTIFLDEIGDMSLDTQSKVLRAIQEKIITRIGGKEDIRIDARLITATHKNLKEEIEKKSFRADLFFRLNVIPLYLPSLSERKEDIPLLIEYFVDKYKTQMKLEGKIKINTQSIQALMSYNWPGNIRELENVIERLLTLKAPESEIELDDLPPEITGKSPHFELADSLYSYQTLKEAVDEFEKRYIIHKLNQFNWNKSKTAEIIQLGRRNLHKKITKFAIEESKNRIEEIEF